MKNFPTVGAMVNRMTLQRPATVDDGHAGHRVAWLDVAEVWAEKVPISSRELFYAHQIKEEITHRIRIRYREGVRSGMRFRHATPEGERFYPIDSVIDMGGARRFLEALCTEVVQDEG